mmetsp:Transcript_30869/g.91648  ORF Transcript_30869/g.91648 Transcript_30869/m.91648 type:complete len:309 (-) Transcript_30869:1078-2004(-)
MSEAARRRQRVRAGQLRDGRRPGALAAEEAPPGGAEAAGRADLRVRHARVLGLEAGREVPAAEVRQPEPGVRHRPAQRLQLRRGERSSGPLAPHGKACRERPEQDPLAVPGHQLHPRRRLRGHGLDVLLPEGPPERDVRRGRPPAVLPGGEHPAAPEDALRADGPDQHAGDRGHASGMRPGARQGGLQPDGPPGRGGRPEAGDLHAPEVFAHARRHGLRQCGLGEAHREAQRVHALRLQQGAVLAPLPRDGDPADQRDLVLRAVPDHPRPPGGRPEGACAHRGAGRPGGAWSGRRLGGLRHGGPGREA